MVLKHQMSVKTCSTASDSVKYMNMHIDDYIAAACELYSRRLAFNGDYEKNAARGM